MCKRYAAHQVILLNGELLKGPQVVEMNEGVVHGIYSLKEEQPFTEWLGGTIVTTFLTVTEVRSIKLPVSVERLITILAKDDSAEVISVSTAWHISPEETAAGIVNSLKQLL